MRWQIELLFKLWKSHNLLGHHRSDDPVRQLVELYAKLTAVIIQHWLTLTTCWSDANLSLTKATRLIRDRLPSLIDALPDVNQLIAVLTRWKTLLHHLARIPKRKKDPSHPELLATPMRLTFTGSLDAYGCRCARPPERTTSDDFYPEGIAAMERFG